MKMIFTCASCVPLRGQRCGWPSTSLISLRWISLFVKHGLIGRITRLYRCRHTLKLVLRGEWPKLSPATKTHLSVTLQRCASHLVQHPAAPRCTALIALVHNPWTHPALDSILNGQPDSEHEEGRSRIYFFSSFSLRNLGFIFVVIQVIQVVAKKIIRPGIINNTRIKYNDKIKFRWFLFWKIKFENCSL